MIGTGGIVARSLRRIISDENGTRIVEPVTRSSLIDRDVLGGNAFAHSNRLLAGTLATRIAPRLSNDLPCNRIIFAANLYLFRKLISQAVTRW